MGENMESEKPRKQIISRKREQLTILNADDTSSKRRDEKLDLGICSVGFCSIEVISDIKVSIFRRMVVLKAIWGGLRSKWRSRSGDKQEEATSYMSSLGRKGQPWVRTGGLGS